MEYSQRIRELREDNDYNQTFVANTIHVAQTTYSDYEKGKVRMPIEWYTLHSKYLDSYKPLSRPAVS